MTDVPTLGETMRTFRLGGTVAAGLARLGHSGRVLIHRSPPRHHRRGAAVAAFAVAAPGDWHVLLARTDLDLHSGSTVR